MLQYNLQKQHIQRFFLVKKLKQVFEKKQVVHINKLGEKLCWLSLKLSYLDILLKIIMLNNFLKKLTVYNKLINC